MKKRIMAIMVCAVAFVMAIGLAGCSSATVLDKEVTIGDMTIKVPSGWAESVNDFSTSAYTSGYNTYSSDDLTSDITISYSSVPIDPEQQLESTRKALESDPVNVTGWYCNDLGSDAIANSTVSKYEYGYTDSSTDRESKKYVAFVDSPELDYEITVSGDDVKLDDLLISMNIA